MYKRQLLNKPVKYTYPNPDNKADMQVPHVIQIWTLPNVAGIPVS